MMWWFGDLIIWLNEKITLYYIECCDCVTTFNNFTRFSVQCVLLLVCCTCGLQRKHRGIIISNTATWFHCEELTSRESSWFICMTIWFFCVTWTENMKFSEKTFPFSTIITLAVHTVCWPACASSCHLLTSVILQRCRPTRAVRSQPLHTISLIAIQALQALYYI